MMHHLRRSTLHGIPVGIVSSAQGWQPRSRPTGHDMRTHTNQKRTWNALNAQRCHAGSQPPQYAAVLQYDDIIMKRSEFHNYAIVGRIGRMGTAFGPIAPADEQNSARHNQGRPGVSVGCLPWLCRALFCSSAARMRTCEHFPIWAYMAIYGFVEKAAFCRN